MQFFSPSYFFCCELYFSVNFREPRNLFMYLDAAKQWLSNEYKIVDPKIAHDFHLSHTKYSSSMLIITFFIFFSLSSWAFFCWFLFWVDLILNSFYRMSQKSWPDKFFEYIPFYLALSTFFFQMIEEDVEILYVRRNFIRSLRKYHFLQK